MKFKLVENINELIDTEECEPGLDESRNDLRILNPHNPKDWAEIRRQHGLPIYNSTPEWKRVATLNKQRSKDKEVNDKE